MANGIGTKYTYRKERCKMKKTRIIKFLTGFVFAMAVLFILNGSVVRATEVRNGLIYEDDAFIYYENDVWIANKYGFVDFSGDKFLVANGMLAEVDGLVKDPDGTAYDWYFCSQGRIVQQHSGFCEYDGNWFLVDNGKLESDATGFYSYDGGLFYLSEGRLLKNANGLMQDPKTGEWYFCANGQAQTSYSGLTLYDGSWFYVQNGYFNPEYSDWVEYDGRVYFVDKGTPVQDYGEGNVTEKEPNSSKRTSTKIALGVPCLGELGSYYKYKSDGLDTDWYQVDLIKGNKYIIGILGWNDTFASTNAIAKLYSSQNDEVSLSYHMEEYGDDCIEFTPPETDTYYIKLYNYFDYSDKDEHYYYVYVAQN